MTFARIKATGSGSIRLRLSIEGFPYEPVTHADMETTAADGRIRYTGLIAKGVKLSQRADIPRATIEANGATFKLADVRKRWTAAFSTEPTATTWLSTACDHDDTTITVKSTANFASSGRFYVDSEVVTYSGKNSTQFTGCTRGVWDSLAQYHYIPDGRFLRYPEVTNTPTVLEGRRVRLYAYGRGDSPTGDGTQIWLGVMSGEPRMSGPTWSISVDPISRILDSAVGADLGEPAGPRGIYFHAAAGTQIRYEFGRNAVSGTVPDTISVGFNIPNSTDGGFWETQEDFLADINDQIETLTSTWGPTITAKPHPSGAYFFEIEQGASAEGILVQVTGAPTEPAFYDAASASAEAYTLGIYVMVANTTYYVHPDFGRSKAGAGLVPRGVFGIDGVRRADDAALAATYPAKRLYLGGAVGVTTNTNACVVSWQDEGGTGSDRTYRITTSDTSGRFIDMGTIPSPVTVSLPDYHWYTPSNLPSIRLGRSYNTTPELGFGSYDLLQTLTTDAPQHVNTGAQPMVRSGDWDAEAWLLAVVTSSGLARQRQYTSLAPVELKEFVSPELQLMGHFLAFDTSGRMVPKKVRLASQTETTTFAITSANLITDDGMPQYERGAIGLLNQLILRDGYDPIEDEYTRPPFIVRDLAAFGRAPIARTLVIEPKSIYTGPPITYDDVVLVAAGVLDIYGGPYAYVSCTVPLTAFDTVLGSTVSITTTQLPSTAGTRGVDDIVGVVVEREIDLYGARISLTILVSAAKVVGYNFGSKVSSQSGASSTWTITVDSTVFADGEDAADHLAVGDRVMVYRYDSATAGTVEGAVTSVATNVVGVLFDNSWTPGADEWFLSAADSDDADGGATTSQKRYAYLAASDANITWDDASVIAARTFG